MADIGAFPALPGLAWSVTKTPTWQTRIQRAASGRELRALDYPFPLWQFSLVFNFLRDNPAGGFNELRTLMGFYLACQGAFSTFLFTDPTDDSVTAQEIGVGDGITAAFQLIRTLGGAIGFNEPILAPNTVTAVYLNGTPTGGYSVNAANGVVTFGSAPGAGVVITADFTYYFRCRFVDDSYQFDNFMFRFWQLKKLSFISVLA